MAPTLLFIVDFSHLKKIERQHFKKKKKSYRNSNKEHQKIDFAQV